jgi:hypothetical protein
LIRGYILHLVWQIGGGFRVTRTISIGIQTIAALDVKTAGSSVKHVEPLSRLTGHVTGASVGCFGLVLAQVSQVFSVCDAEVAE